MAVKAVVDIVRSYSDYDGNLMVDCCITAPFGYVANITLGPFPVTSPTINADIKTIVLQYTTDNWGFSYIPLVDTVAISRIINTAVVNAPVIG